MKGIDLAIAFDPEYIRRAALLASFEYPAVAIQELYKGWSKVPVWPRLWEYAALKTGKGEFPSLDDMVEFLLKLTEEGDSGVKHRAQKLVMDFIREIHAYALLVHSGAFLYVKYQRILDFQYNIDFEVQPKALQNAVGIQTAVRKNWGRDTWNKIHEERRHRRRAKDWKGSIFWMTNRRIAVDRLPNKIWLFKIDHVQEVISQIKAGQQLSYLDTLRAPPAATSTTAPPKASSELEQLRLNWKRVIEQAPEDTKRTPVIAILRSTGVKPVAIDDDTVVLAFRYPLHKEKIGQPENQQVAEKILSNFLGHPCCVRCVYEPEDNHLVREALKMGAQIIDVEEKEPT